MNETSNVIKQKYDAGAKELTELKIGTAVFNQNPRSQRWDKSGVIVEVGKYRQYYVNMGGSGRITLRNRRHIRSVLVTRPIVPKINVATPTESNLGS